MFSINTVTAGSQILKTDGWQGKDSQNLFGRHSNGAFRCKLRYNVTVLKTDTFRILYQAPVRCS
jgi:hypothetical protein